MQEMMMLRLLLLLCVFLFLAGSFSAIRADDDGQSSGDVRFFESKIRPILVKHCYECHSIDAGVSESGLRLDTREAVGAGGDRGPALIAGKPQESLLLQAIAHADPELKMPPRVERLSDGVIADFKRWIERGAVDPRKEAPASSIEVAGSEFWAYQRPVPTPIPAVDKSDAVWCRSEIDRFVLQKLKQHDLRPSADSPPETLLRRLHFDLIGLPPAPDDIDDFVHSVEANGIDIALGDRVDRLLQSAAFGQRWGRHWLDVARFAESSGKEANISFPYAWRYRDYVIDAVNDDVPFDRFLTEQIAGDLLVAKDDAERTRLLIATGFLALGPKNLDAANPLQFDADLVDEQIDAVTRVFMASSVACARCHDHKFDPFSMEDYYALAGIFASTKTYFGTAVSPSNRVGGDPLVLPNLDSTLILHRSISAKKVEALKADKAAMQKEKAEKGTSLTLRDALRIIWRTGAIDGQLEKVDEKGNALPLAMGVLDDTDIRDAALMLRGEVNRPSAFIPRAYPKSISVTNPPRINKDQSGRLELAKWLTKADHPLTARVAVNRVWSQLFGAGLVNTVDDFGSTGESPSHPELLDHLAERFIREGWSRKRLIRRIVLSRAYRQASTFKPVAFQLDPENRLLWRMSKRRIEAEAMRDAMLSVSGELDLQRPQGSLVGRVIGDRPISLVGLDKRLPRDLDGSVHRSIYLPVMRDRLPDVLEVFDFAEPSLVTGKREATNVPTQALYLMNSPFVHDRAEAMANRLRRETKNDHAFIEKAFRYCYGRGPTSDETIRVLTFLQFAEHGDKKTGDKNTGDRFRQVVSCCQALLSTAEFRVLD
jgi:mono/diheme cytochrome c family protein